MSQRENVNPIRKQDHRKNSRRYQKRAAARRRRNTIFIMEIVLLLILAVVLFFVSKLSKIEKTKLDMDKIEVNEDISQEMCIRDRPYFVHPLSSSHENRIHEYDFPMHIQETRF